VTRLIAIILTAVVVSAFVAACTTSYILDRRWSAYAEQLTVKYEKATQETKDEHYARGYWRGTYEMCLINFQGDTFTCLRGVRNGYKAGSHLEPAPPGWDWFMVKYAGQVQ
jgi:hypothetical protein